MFELIYKYCRENDSYNYDIIVFCRMKSMEEIIGNVVVKYNIPLSEENINDSCKDGFYIRELPEKSLNENSLNHYLEYHRNTEWKRK